MMMIIIIIIIFNTDVLATATRPITETVQFSFKEKSQGTKKNLSKLTL